MYAFNFFFLQCIDLFSQLMMEYVHESIKLRLLNINSCKFLIWNNPFHFLKIFFTHNLNWIEVKFPSQFTNNLELNSYLDTLNTLFLTILTILDQFPLSEWPKSSNWRRWIILALFWNPIAGCLKSDATFTISVLDSSKASPDVPRSFFKRLKDLGF